MDQIREALAWLDPEKTAATCKDQLPPICLQLWKAASRSLASSMSVEARIVDPMSRRAGVRTLEVGSGNGPPILCRRVSSLGQNFIVIFGLEYCDYLSSADLLRNDEREEWRKGRQRGLKSCSPRLALA